MRLTGSAYVCKHYLLLPEWVEEEATRGQKTTLARAEALANPHWDLNNKIFEHEAILLLQQQLLQQQLRLQQHERLGSPWALFSHSLP